VALRPRVPHPWSKVSYYPGKAEETYVCMYSGAISAFHDMRKEPTVFWNVSSVVS
jgi:hypothetical protein